jgi:hypothetical protein
VSVPSGGSSIFRVLVSFLTGGLHSTFKALSSKEKILEKLQEIAFELEGDLTRLGFTGKTVTLKYKLDTYQGKITFRVDLTNMRLTCCSFHPRQIFRSLD